MTAHSSAPVDLQVNGYGGVDFNQDDLTQEMLEVACARLEADGVGGILATIITDTLEQMQLRLVNLARFRASSDVCRRMIAGIHIEGPFINPAQGYRGAHPADAICPATEDVMKKLLEAAGGLTKLVTLAPEQDAGFKVIGMLAKAGVVISAGHCDPAIDQLRGAIDAGLTLFTHLGNGCPMQMHRHDNIIQRALSLSDRLWTMFIADGVHVPFFALKNYLKVVGIDRAIVVTDAIAPAGLGPGRYKLARWDLVIGRDMVARAPDGSHFVGSGITMKQSIENLIAGVGLKPEQAIRLVSENPRKAVKMISDL